VERRSGKYFGAGTALHRVPAPLHRWMSQLLHTAAGDLYKLIIAFFYSAEQQPTGESRKVKGKVFPYSLPSVGPGADPGVQAVSPQVT